MGLDCSITFEKSVKIIPNERVFLYTRPMDGWDWDNSIDEYRHADKREERKLKKSTCPDVLNFLIMFAKHIIRIIFLLVTN